MHVHDGNDVEMFKAGRPRQERYTQTNPIEGLPCTICVENHVAVHPAVTAGIVP